VIVDRSVHVAEGDQPMHVSMNGVRLFVDVEGAKFVPRLPTSLANAIK
jgi:hypothetical protein